MARLYNHGRKVADFTRESFVTYRLMSDGKFLKSKGRGWKLAKFSQPVAVVVSQQLATWTVIKYDEALYQSLTVVT